MIFPAPSLSYNIFYIRKLLFQAGKIYVAYEAKFDAARLIFWCHCLGNERESTQCEVGSLIIG
jgi:hypothetical protein